MLHDKATTSQPLGRCFDSREGAGGAERSAPRFGQPSGPRSAVKRGCRPTPAPSERSSCRSRGAELCVFRLPHRNVASVQRQRWWARVKGSSRHAHGAGLQGCSLRGVCWTRFSVCSLIHPHHSKERARNFTANRTWSAYRRTSA